MGKTDVLITCRRCGGTGLLHRIITNPDGTTSTEEYICPGCNGTKYMIIGKLNEETYIDIIDKLQELKTKLNQIQADINYIKAKV